MSGELYTSTEVPVTYQAENVQFLPDHTKVFAGSTTGFSIIDFPAISTEHAFDDPQTEAGVGEGVGWTGTDILSQPFSAGEVWRWNYTGHGVFEANVYAGDIRGVNTMFDVNGDVHWWNDKLFAYDQFSIDGTIYDSNALTGAYFYPVQLFGSQDGKLWMFGQRADTTTAVFYNVTDNSYFLVTGLPAGDAGGALHYTDGTHDQFVFSWDGGLYAVDKTSHSIVASNTSLLLDYASTRLVFKSVSYIATNMWVGFEQVSLVDLTVLQTYDPADWGYAQSLTLYDTVQNALVIGIGGYTLVWLFLGLLPEIAAGECTGLNEGGGPLGPILRCDDGIFQVTAVTDGTMTLELISPPRRYIHETSE